GGKGLVRLLLPEGERVLVTAPRGPAQPGDLDPAKPARERIEGRHGVEEQEPRAVQVAVLVLQLVEAGGEQHQAAEELAHLALGDAPDHLPALVGLEEVAVVEGQAALAMVGMELGLLEADDGTRHAAEDTTGGRGLRPGCGPAIGMVAPPGVATAPGTAA